MAAASLELVGYSDANLAGCLDSGAAAPPPAACFCKRAASWLSHLGCSIRWRDRRWRASTWRPFDGAQEAEQLRTLLAHMGSEQIAPTIIHEDNTAALAMAMAAGRTHQSRYIRIRYHFTWELVAAGVITEHVSTAGQPAGRRPDKECRAGAAAGAWGSHGEISL
ncbi:unnamed protein product [Phaeothamnion confervicola]